MLSSLLWCANRARQADYRSDLDHPRLSKMEHIRIVLQFLVRSMGLRFCTPDCVEERLRRSLERPPRPCRTPRVETSCP